MNRNDRDTIHSQMSTKVLLMRIVQGMATIFSSKVKLTVFFMVMFGECLLLYDVNCYATNNSGDVILGEKFAVFSTMFLAVTILIALDIIILSLVGTPIDAFRQKRGFQKIGMINRALDVPVLLKKTEQRGLQCYEYLSNGIPVARFLDEKEKIEAALNLSIVEIYQGKDKTRVIILARDGSVQLPELVYWSEEYLQHNPSKIVLGQAVGGLRIVDLDVTPHIQCGGITGSGKTVLLKCVLHQLYRNGVEIYLCDFKGFVDFASSTRNLYHCIESKEQLNETLDLLLNMMDERKKRFSGTDCANITEYNEMYPAYAYPRIFLASDEIAYAFQKKGLAKAEKELVEQIEAKMTLIAQQGRFAGINLWLSTQRGDADTIPPQIRSNMTVRFCGRASDILSRVTIDNSLASEIPQHIRGRFVEDTEEMFQAFLYEGV